jgi:RNA polymerase sigma-70 factor (ECF subfamily)
LSATEENNSVVLLDSDRNLVERCLERRPLAWEEFVDRFMGLVVHVVNHSAHARSIRLSPEDRDDLCAEVFLHFIQDNFAILRHFRGQASLATYLTVVARRVAVRKMLQQKSAARLGGGLLVAEPLETADAATSGEERLNNHEEIARLLEGLDATEAKIVRMFHLEGSSYQEISSAVGVSENSIGPILSRARNKMREARVHPAGN